MTRQLASMFRKYFHQFGCVPSPSKQPQGSQKTMGQKWPWLFLLRRQWNQEVMDSFVVVVGWKVGNLTQKEVIPVGRDKQDLIWSTVAQTPISVWVCVSGTYMCEIQVGIFRQENGYLGNTVTDPTQDLLWSNWQKLQNSLGRKHL